MRNPDALPARSVRRFLDTELTLDRRAVDARGGLTGDVAAQVLRTLRGAAQARAEATGGAVVATVDPEVRAVEAIEPGAGEIYVVAARWVVDASEDAIINDDFRR